MLGEKLDPRKVFGKAVTDLAAINQSIVVFSADSGKSSGFGEFSREYSDRYFECGIMEQGIIGMASGMATVGKIPVFCAIAPFVTARPYEMFRNDLGYMHQNVKVVGRNCGITYSDLGATHQSLDDFGLIRLIPNVVILAPQDPTEIKMAVKAMIDYAGPVYMRIGNPKIPVLFEEIPFEIGKGRLIQDGDDLTIISTGSMTATVIEASKILEKNGYSVRVIGLPTVYPLDEELIRSSAEKTKRVMTIEEHYCDGGMGTMVCELLSDTKNVTVNRLGIPKEYGTTGEYADLLAYYHLDLEGIVQSAIRFILEG
ncbi:transketolase C-terminal domain-containing protein [uncultured Acetobacterium sp.]|uniref:transketolase family protein n=1 Tax=uncultured Acetobacterium sp. TaxID=217139 RepID=UPI0025F98397|nr:transketolase C-terminal domain-containing protein [uncultured Acetobacterium sp.]